MKRFSSSLQTQNPNEIIDYFKGFKNTLILCCGILLTSLNVFAAVTTTAVSSITGTTAVSGGTCSSTVTNDWITEVGIVWGTATGPTVALATKTSTTYTYGSQYYPLTFNGQNMTGLTCATTYYVRAYTRSGPGAGTVEYGNERTFTTPSGASVNTVAISSITGTTASSGGTGIACAPSVTQKGIVWATTTNPTTANSSTTNGAGTANYTSNMTGLTMGTTYYVRAYVINAGVTSYGPEIVFKTRFTGVAPYSITPQWYFGNRGGLSFPGNNYPSSAGPTAVTRVSNTINNEASTSVSYRSGAVALYSNSMEAYNAADASIRNFQSGGDNTCAGSSTGGSIAFPNPKNSNNEFYLVLANDLTSGGCANRGQSGYRFARSGANQAYAAGPGPGMGTQGDALASEAVAVSTDGEGTYWLVGHGKSSSTFYIWKFDTTGAITATSQSAGISVSTPNSQSTIKFSPCQDKIAISGESKVQVFNWNRKTGVIGASIFSGSGASYFTRGGLEFSEDGTKLYFSDYSFSDVYQIDLTTGTLGTAGIGHGINSWSMQLGPDGNIYTSPNTASGGTVAITKQISNTNSTTPTITNISLGTGRIFQGLNNLAWLSPNNPIVASTNGTTCDVKNFSYTFTNYFNSGVNVLPGSEVWNWGDGTSNTTGSVAPSHTFVGFTPGTPRWYVVRLTFKDLYCNQDWTDTIHVKVDCPVSTPVEFVKVAASKYDNDKVRVVWVTAIEKNNDYFEVQRSADGKNFTTIGKVAGSGTTSNTQTYSFIDSDPLNGSSYYRVIQVDIDKSSKPSPIAPLQLSKTLVLVAPNPFTEDFVVTVEGITDKANINVYDATGRLVLQGAIDPSNSTVRLGGGLDKGSYIVEVIGTDVNVHQKMIKK